MPRLRPPKEADKPEEVLEADTENLFENKDGEGEVLFEVKEQKGNKERTEPPAEDDEKLALRKQIEDLQKSERLAKEAAEQAQREREEALRMAQTRASETATAAQALTESRLDAVNAAIAAAQAEAATAQHDWEAADAIGDLKAKAEAQRKMVRAEANIARLEDGKVALEEAKKNPPKPQETAPNDGLDNTQLPENAKQWLRAHPEYLRDQRKNAKLQSLHFDVLDEGHQPFSKAYFESMERHLGLREPERSDEEEEDEIEVVEQPRRKGPVQSAPVSREAPGGQPQRPSEVRLTAQEAEAAKMAGITPREYATQKLRLAKMKADGYEQYGERK